MVIADIVLPDCVVLHGPILAMELVTPCSSRCVRIPDGFEMETCFSATAPPLCGHCSVYLHPQIYMGRLRVDESLMMMRHYFGKVSPQDEAALKAVFREDKLSPADLESMCAEYDTTAELVEAVTARLAGSGEDEFRSC